MEDWLVTSLDTLVKVGLSILAIFTLIMIITRISGLKTFAKMSSFDFESTIALDSILASIVLNTDQSILKGAISLAGIITFQSVFPIVNASTIGSILHSQINQSC